jgi:hypothetical protein
MKKELLKKETCIFLNSYDEREIFLDIFFYQLQKYINYIPIYLIKGPKKYTSKESNLNITVINTDYGTPLNKNFLYDNNWGYRYIEGLNILKNKGYKYVIRFDDDGFIQDIDNNLFNDSILELMNLENLDRIQLYGPDPSNELTPINNEYSLISKNGNYGHYVTNQCSLWNIESCFKIIHENINACSIEGTGSSIARQTNMRFACPNQSIITGYGLNRVDLGLENKGLNIVKEYCDHYNLNYEEILLKIKNWKE